MSSNIQAKSPPSLGIPPSSSTCQLSIINTTTDIITPLDYLVEPDIPGYKWLNLPTYSFHIKHQGTGKELLFDLGCRTDWEDSVPHIAKLVENVIPGLRVEKDVLDILAEGKVDINNAEALILSHWHFDHCGAPSKLPKKLKMIVGPGFRDEFLPGWPGKESSPFHEADFEGRDVVEPPFSDDFKVGKFQAHDYFGDGSLYVLNVPGHATGHISTLVRTTPDTFVFLGGDVCHHAGDFRPTEYVPLPKEIPRETVLDRRIPHPCPCLAFLSSHPARNEGQTTPFFNIATGPSSFYHEPAVAQKSADALKEFDADPNVLVTIAHDPASLDAFEFFPDATMNEWKEKGWKKKSHWGFLSEMPYNGKITRSPITDGLYKGKEKIRGLEIPPK